MADAMLAKQANVSSESEDSNNKKKKRGDKRNDKDLKESSSSSSAKKTVKQGSDKSSPPFVPITPRGNKSSSSTKMADTGREGDHVQNSTDSGPTLSDIMTYLQTMKSDQDKSNRRLDDLSSKVDELYEMDYDEDALLYDDDRAEEPSQVNDNVPSGTDDNNNTAVGSGNDTHDAAASNDTNNNANSADANTEPPSKRQKTGENTSVFKSLVEKFKIKDKVDDAVDNELADLVNSFFRDGMPDEQLSEVLKSVHRPENCQMLTKTRVNQLIWNLLSDYTRGEENKIQYRQGLVVKAAILITEMLDKMNIFKNKDNNADFPQEVFDMATNALGLLGHFHRTANLYRRDMHRPDLNYEYYHLCSTKVPYTDYLYGDTVTQEVSDINSVNKIGRKLRGRGFLARGARGRGRAFRRLLRGRGLGRGRARGKSSYKHSYDDQDTQESHGASSRFDQQGPSRYDYSKNSRRGFNKSKY